jgi:hypothetical protein
MRDSVFVGLVLIFLSVLFQPVAFSQVKADSCRLAFNHITEEFHLENAIKICNNSNLIPFQYFSEVNMPVCDDTLCANVELKIFWDLAGNYAGFDTIAGKPLTKFDHKKFISADYLKLDEILKNRNSTLRMLNKEDLVDKSVKVKATTVDAVTGATPATIKKATVEGAVYTCFTLWHFVNGVIRNKMALFTQNIYSEPVARQMLKSGNHETQLFALRNMSEKDYEIQADLLFEVVGQSAPLIKAYIITKAPLPYSELETNRQFAALFPKLDDYSKSIFLNRVTTEKEVALVFLPMLLSMPGNLNHKQQELIAVACKKFEIQEVNEQRK